MVVDAAQDVGQIGLRVEAVNLGGFNRRHGAGQCFGAGIGPREEPIFSSESNRAQGSLGRLVVDRHPAVFEEHDAVGVGDGQ